MTPKVFCIGFHKTGTSSLAIALTKLNYNVCRRLEMVEDKIPTVNVVTQLKKRHYDDILSVTDYYDAFCDNPWLLLYKEIDQKYPDCKFILTTRDEKSWIKSVCNYFNDSTSEIRSIIYGKGSPLGNESLYLEKYKQHKQEVIQYFKGKPHKLFILDLNDEKKWEKLCAFLAQKVPLEPFPFENKTNTTKVPQKKRISFQKLLNYFKLSNQKKFLFIEAFISISISRFLIIFFAFKTIAKKLGSHQQESPLEIDPTMQLKAIEIEKVIKKVSLYTPFRSLCFEQALCCKIMLKRRNIPSTIYFGLAKKSSGDSSRLKAHAWLRSGQHILTGKRGKNNFKVVSFFGDSVSSSNKSRKRNI